MRLSRDRVRAMGDLRASELWEECNIAYSIPGSMGFNAQERVALSTQRIVIVLDHPTQIAGLYT